MLGIGSDLPELESVPFGDSVGRTSEVWENGHHGPQIVLCHCTTVADGQGLARDRPSHWAPHIDYRPSTFHARLGVLDIVAKKLDSAVVTLI